MFYNWAFTLKECEEGQEENGVFIGGYELDVCVLEEKHSAKPVTNVCKSFAGIAEEDMKNSKLTLAELIFLEYAIEVYLNPTNVFTAYNNLCQKLVPIAAEYLIDLKNLNKRTKYTKRIWWLRSYGYAITEEILRSGQQLLNVELNNSTVFELSVEPVKFSQYGDVALEVYSDRIEPKNLPQNIPEIVKCFYNTVRWIKTNPRQVKEMSKLCDELERLEKGYEFLLEKNIPVEKITEQLFYRKDRTVTREEDVALGPADQYSYLIVFQDLLHPDLEPMGSEWIGAISLQPLFNIALYKQPSESSNVTFVKGWNVSRDAVEAGSKEAGLAGKLCELALKPTHEIHQCSSEVKHLLNSFFK